MFGINLVAVCIAAVIIIFSSITEYFQRRAAREIAERQSENAGQDISTGLAKEEKDAVAVPLSAKRSESGLNIIQFNEFKVLKVTKVSHNTKVIRFEIPGAKRMGSAIGRHLSLRAMIDGNYVIRPYTPISKPDQEGYFDLLIKRYDSGKLTPYLHSLKIGSSVDIRGPVGRYKYAKNSFEHIGLIAGGSGLTPCLQIIRCLLESEEYKDDKTRMTLLFQNRTEEDVLLRKELEALKKTHTGRLDIYFHVTNVGHRSPFGKKSREVVGYIDEECISSLLGPKVCQHICICGPTGFNQAMNKLVLDAGHSEKSVFLW